MPLLTSSISFVATDHDVTQDVLGELDRPLELARLVRGQRVLEDTVLTIAVLADLVCQPAALGWRRLVDLPAEGGDRLLQAVGHGRKALLVGGGLHEVHELVWAHVVAPPPFPGSAADVLGARWWERVALVRGEKAPRPVARAVPHSVPACMGPPQRRSSDRPCVP